MGLLKEWTHGGTCPGGWFLGNYSLGLERTTIRVDGVPYLGRWILYVGNRTFRLHTFYQGDDARAPHDHPWPFWTMPTKTYWESYVAEDDVLITHRVAAWRWHYRPSSYRHIVLGTHAVAAKHRVKFTTPKPFWTFVMTGKKDRSWGFWPGSKTFVPWWEWK